MKDICNVDVNAAIPQHSISKALIYYLKGTINIFFSASNDQYHYSLFP